MNVNAKVKYGRRLVVVCGKEMESKQERRSSADRDGRRQRRYTRLGHKAWQNLESFMTLCSYENDFVILALLTMTVC